MKFHKTKIITTLIIFHVIIGVYIWSGTRVMNASFLEQSANFIITVVLWPLLIGTVMFYSLAFPTILGTVIALVFAIKKYYDVSASLFLAIALLLSSLFLPITIKNQGDLSSVTMGLPVAFFTQDQSQLEPPLPWHTHAYSALENPTTILWPQFVTSFLVVFVLLWSVFASISIFSRYRKNFRSPA